jgi:hypothetical protein
VREGPFNVTNGGAGKFTAPAFAGAAGQFPATSRRSTWAACAFSSA